METKKTTFTKTGFKNYIIAEAMKYMNAGDPLTGVKMNSTDVEKMTDGSAPTKVTSSVAPDVKLNFEEPTDQKDVKMNQNEKEQGQVKEGHPLVGVSGADKETKGVEDKTKESAPFDEKVGEVKMNEMDGEGDSSDKAKTSVSAGSEVGKGFKTGGHKADFSETAKNDKETAKRIADGIELKEGFQFKNRKELLEYITKEAEKIAKVL